jgi:hypothetical protein
MYFKALPKMFYPYGNTKTLVPDIFRRVHLDKYFQNRLHLQEYYISDQESPEIVADKFYGSSKYHWLVIIANNIVDVKREWPLSNNSLVAYCDDKYGEENRTDVHHYVMTEDKTVIVDWDATLVANGTYQAVTNLDYETDLNNNKRQILLLHKQFLRDITAQYLRLVK